MSHGLRFAVSELLHNPHTRRTILILGTLLIAALVGGAPHDHGGGG
jgi:hypothetical protein